MTMLGILGAGTMGSGIAQVAVAAGLQVVLVDVDETRVAKGRDAVAAGLEKLVKKGTLAAAEREAALLRIRGSNDLAPLSACGFVIEAATEDEALKVKILRQIDDVAAALARTLGKKPIVMKSAPGFVVNRLLIPMVNEAVFAYAEGVAGVNEIDEAMKLGANHPMGPLAGRGFHIYEGPR